MAMISLQAAYDQTRRWVESNDHERAIGLAQHILAQYPENLEAHRILGEAYLSSRQLERAQESFERVLRSDPENIPAHVGLGITYERQGKLDRAVPEFEQAWEIKPDMVELRSQLLRLYSEAWGSEHAQLRLSKAGLARLYAKGHMLPQAIGEFRQVIVEHPHRMDARVALAEALWRDGQDDEAIGVCREILSRQPNSLKANLLLGYLLAASNQAEGQQYLEKARQLDPYQAVARAMFDTPPGPNAEEPVIEEWDESTWRQQRELEQQASATRPIPVPAEQVEQHAEPVEAGRFAQRPPPPIAAPRASEGDNDDFLAVLLSGGAAGAAAAATSSPEPETFDLDADTQPFSLHDIEADTADKPQEAADEPNLAPFSFSELGLTDEEILGVEPQREAEPAQPAEPSSEDEPALTPFSLSDLGLSDDDIDSFNTITQDEPAQREVEPAQPAEPSSEDEPALTPFSLSDLGLSDDEIASFSTPAQGQASEPAQPAEPLSEDEPALTPFSLSDLGLSDDEIASFSTPAQGQASEPAQPAEPSSEDEPALTPFSLSDLGLSDDEIANLNDIGEPAAAQPAREDAADVQDEEPTLTPFSLSDLGLSDDEIASLDSIGEGGDTSAESPFGRASGAGEQSAADDESGDVPMDLRPFSLDELDVPGGQPSANLPSSLQPFSLDEAPPELPRTPTFTPPPQNFSSSPEPEDDDAPLPQTGGFSWQQPSQRAKPGYMSSARQEESGEGMSIFAKLKQRKATDAAPPSDEATGAYDDDDADDQRMLFSLDNVSLRDEDTTAQPAAQETAPTSEAPAQQESPAPRAADLENLSAGLAAGSIQPFSLSDLGLSEEEIAALGVEGSAGGAQNFASMVGGSDEPSGSAPQPADEQASETPEPASVQADLEESLTLEPEAPADDESEDLKPFSLTDLGLSAEEIDALGLDEAYQDEPKRAELGLTEEELAGLDIADIDWNKPIASTPEAAPSAEELSSGDRVADRLINLGRQQGYVDIADIIAGVENPEAEAERIEEIGRMLHAANIQIRDGDEVIDMEAEYAEEESSDLASIDFSSTPEAPAQEPDMTPFSLSDLGLSDDEIAALGLEEPAAEPVVPASDEPDMKPFSLSDLGLSDDEIAALGLEEPVAAEPAGEPAAPAQEPDMKPFSLSDLGLSDDEIAALGLEEPAAAEPAGPAQEPEMTPFSLSDLGLSDDEIAALGLEEPAAAEPAGEPAAPAQEPDMTPFSLSDLGLSDDEISALGLEEGSTAATEAQESELAAEPEQPAAPPAAEPTRAEAEPARAEPQQAPTTPARPEPVAARQPASVGAAAESNPMLAGYLQRLEADPHNYALRLALARVSGQIGQADVALQQYRTLVKQSQLLDQVSSDLQDLIADAEDQTVLQRLHRLLGDVYSKQGRINEAIEEYSWTFGAN